MKKFLSCSFALLIHCSFLLAQTSTSPVKEPEYVGMGFIENTGVTLEKQIPQSKTKVSASTYVVGLGKTTNVQFVDGAKSTIRIQKNDTIRLVIRVGSQDLNPYETIAITSFTSDVKKNRRTVNNGTINYTNGEDRYGFENPILFTAKKYGNQSFIISLVKLESGEYVIKIPASMHFLMFGVD